MKKKKKIKILSSSFKFPNVRSFLYPFILFDKYLIKNNIHCQINPIKKKTYDLIFIESNFFGREWAVNSERVIESIYNLKKIVRRLYILIYQIVQHCYILKPLI